MIVYEADVRHKIVEETCSGEEVSIKLCEQRVSIPAWAIAEG